MAQTVFKRYEKKYMLTLAQRDALQEKLAPYMALDAYGESTICNIYYDTPDFRLIRESLEKPVYKEKLRMRTYGVPDADHPAFVEIKKKYKGVVYKRRVTLPYEQASQWMNTKQADDEKSNDHLERKGQDQNALEFQQIVAEIDWFCKYYKNLQPAVVLCYDRCAWFGLTDDALRITFDRNIRYRTWGLDLQKGDTGTPLLAEDTCLMEIKIAGAMPLWMAEMLDELQVYPTSFLKYGTAYKQMITEQTMKTQIMKEQRFKEQTFKEQTIKGGYCFA